MRTKTLVAVGAAVLVLAAGGAWAYRWWDVQAARQRGRDGQPAYTAEELEAMSRNLYRAQSTAMDAQIQTWRWSDRGPVTRTPTGILFVKLAAGADTARAQSGTRVEWTGEVRLPDSTLCFAFPVDSPLAFEVDRADLPSGFHALAQQLADGDSVEALLPSYLGWGLSGHAPEVPTDAVLWLRIRQRWADE